jgi:hypothetical protein
MNTPQLSRKEEIEKGCGNIYYDDDFRYVCRSIRGLCPTCQARLDERIRAEQDFLKMIDELKSTIKQEKTE